MGAHSSSAAPDLVMPALPLLVAAAAFCSCAYASASSFHECLASKLLVRDNLSRPALPIGRAEPIRLALAAAGVDFEFEAVDKATIKSDPEHYPFGQSPRCAPKGGWSGRENGALLSRSRRDAGDALSLLPRPAHDLACALTD